MPTSLHGCAALLNYVLETSDEDFPDTADGVTFIRAVVRNVAKESNIAVTGSWRLISDRTLSRARLETLRR